LETITLTIDGKPVSCIPGTSILNAAKKLGIKIPTLCNHHALPPFGACRLCLVEDEKTGRIMSSCVTPALPDMIVRTDSLRIKNHRTNIIRLLMAEHPESCLVCNKGNRCKLREIAAQLGISQTDLYSMPHYKPLEQANPFIVRDLNKCILCGTCIRADHELVFVGAIDYHQRGFHCRPATLQDRPLEDSQCTLCGTCVSLCPTGALSTRNTTFLGSPEQETLSICGFCGVGCCVSLGIAFDRVVESNPSHQEGTVNGSTLCVRGHFAHDFLNSADRLTSPLIRQNDTRIATSWENALDIITDRLFSLKNIYGPQSIAFLGSSKCTNEENYLFQKIARVFLKTNNIDNGGYGSGRSVWNDLVQKIGGSRVNALADLEHAGAIFLLGADPTQSTPVVGYYIKKAAKNGIPLIIADPIINELASSATLWLPINPHTELTLINGISSFLCEQNMCDTQFIEQFTEGFSLYRESLASINRKKVYAKIGVGEETLKKTATLLQNKKIAFVVGEGVTLQKNSSQCLEAIVNLSLMTGSLRDKGGGLYFLARENNQCGAEDMGSVPDSLPGHVSIKNDPGRKEWEGAWGTKLSPDPGLNLVRMIEEAENGNLKALYIMGENPLRSLPQPEKVRKALSNVEFIVVQDILDNETAKIAHVILPGAAPSEKGGSFTNLEGKIQGFEPAVSPPGDAKPDWQILDLLSVKMKNQKPFGSLKNIRKEIRKLIPLYVDIGKEGAWIKQTGQTRFFTSGKKGDLIPFCPVISIDYDASEADYPFTALLGSVRFHLGSGTRTSRSERIRNFAHKGHIEISFQDAKKLTLNAGDTVRVISPYGIVVRRITIVNTLREGLIFVPTGFNANDARNLIELSLLEEAISPGWKEVRVKIEKVEENF
jgi:predicted molibdopterin-dependent oxidoreductase YjgC